MKRSFIKILSSSGFTLIPYVFIIAFISSSCEEPDYEIGYQDGYPNMMAGNWIAFDYQLEKNNFQKALDTINDFNLQSLSEFDRFVNLLTLTAVSDEYNLVTALDPADTSSIIINNIYNLGIRTRAARSERKFDTRLGVQLDFLNQSGYNIHYVSLSGQLVEGTEGDILFIIAGLYDKEKALLESLLITAYRKTGFEDTQYKSLLNK